MAQEFNSPFSPFGAPKPEEELLYPEQGMQFGGTGNSLFGTQPTDGGVDPTVLAGLGLGGGIVAAGTGGAPATTGQIVPSGGSAKPPIKIAEKVGQARLPGTAGSGSEGKLRVPGASTISKLLSTGASFLFPEPLDDSTVSGAYDRLMEAGDVERAEALGYTDPLTEMANAAYQEMLARKDIPQMSRLGDEPLTFTAPTGPSSAPQRAAELAATLPDDSGLMGAPGVQGTGIPTTTLDIDGGSVTVPQALADQTFQGIGAAPMSIEETRARLGGRTLNEYLNAPSGTEGVSGLRTDPQGRMIPAGFETRADAYGDYERESAAREGRLAARMQQPGESITERDTRNAAARTQSSQNVPTDVREAMLTPEGRRTAKQINRLARWSGSTQGQEMGGVAGLEQILQPVDVDPQQQQYDEMRLYKLGLEIEKMQKEKPTEYQEAAAAVDEAISAGDITPGKRSNAILSKLGYDLEELLGSGLNGGGNVFNTVEEAEAANLPPGTQVTIGGKKAIIE